MHPHAPISRHRRRTVVFAIAAVLLAACGGPADDDSDSSPSNGSPPAESDPADETTDSEEEAPDAPDEPTSEEATSEDDAGDDAESMTFTDCEADRYTVGYPAEWNVNDDEGLIGPCEIFHPGDIEVPEHPRDRDLHYAVSMYVDEVDFEARAANDSRNEVLEESETTVDGRRALVVEYRSTGGGLVPEGERSYSWSIDLDGEILVVTTSTVGETDYERDKRVIDRMVDEELAIHDESTD